VTAATSPSSDTEAVIDASGAVRALVYADETAEPWLRTRIVWPTLVYPEFARAVLRLHRGHVVTLEQAHAALDNLHLLAADARPVESLARGAWDVALDRNLTVYDACYVVLAEALDAPLVTAGRGLAAATRNAVLLP
jgi:predicted nucleic acid-binding protein